MHRPMTFAATAVLALSVASCGGTGRENAAGSAERESAADGAEPGPAANAAAPGGDGGNDAAAAPADPFPDEMRWTFSRSVRGPKLAYGEPATDNVRLMLRCEGGEAILSFMRSEQAVRGRPDEIVLVGGGERWSIPVETQASQLGGVTVEARAPLSAPPLRRLRAGEPLELRWGPETISLPAGAARQDQVERFFEACQASRPG